MAFLKKAMLRGNLDDVYDSRDLRELFFRTMRSLITTNAAHYVAADLEGEVLPSIDKEALIEDISRLWKDTNPLVCFLSKLRPSLNFSHA